MSAACPAVVRDSERLPLGNSDCATRIPYSCQKSDTPIARMMTTPTMRTIKLIAESTFMQCIQRCAVISLVVLPGQNLKTQRAGEFAWPGDAIPADSGGAS